ncbi:MAG: hypothetical protein ACREMY_15535 [bacterium]
MPNRMDTRPYVENGARARLDREGLDLDNTATAEAKQHAGCTAWADDGCCTSVLHRLE